MKIITFNTWGGRAGLAGIKNFIERHHDVDIFCLQEIWQTEDISLIETMDERLVTDLLAQIAQSLPEAFVETPACREKPEFFTTSPDFAL